jgi:hypothetical protein
MCTSCQSPYGHTQKGTSRKLRQSQFCSDAQRLHPAEEHALVAETTSRPIVDRTGNVVGRVPMILPGSLDERELLAQIDDQRWQDAKSATTPTR